MSKGGKRTDAEQPGMQHQGSMRYKFNFIADVVDKIVPAVVHLELFQRVPFSGEEISLSSGSGFVVSEDGWIVTNTHVLTNKQRIKVELKSGVHYDATVKDVDQKMDIALIKIEPDSPLPVLHLGQSSDLRPGEFVVAYGNSGGPLVNLDGDVIGINTLKVAAGISFAIPVDRVRQFLDDSYIRQVNGERELIFIQHLKEREDEFPNVSSGVYIYEVIPGTAASSAGIINHDVIIGINGQPIHTIEEVREAVQNGRALSVMLRRKDKDVLTIIPED
ncbi:hypothetical protein ABVT39_006415 [Epinephelus coioides]